MESTSSNSTMSRSGQSSFYSLPRTTPACGENSTGSKARAKACFAQSKPPRVKKLASGLCLQAPFGMNTPEASQNKNLPLKIMQKHIHTYRVDGIVSAPRRKRVKKRGNHRRPPSGSDLATILALICASLMLLTVIAWILFD